MKANLLKLSCCMLFAACVSATSLALAQQGPEQSVATAPVAPLGATVPSDQTHPIGNATHALLTMQSSNASAAPEHAGGGEEATLAYRRYLDSFKHPIPTFFSSSTGKANGASGGTAN